jgi:hypothetical protein
VARFPQLWFFLEPPGPPQNADYEEQQYCSDECNEDGAAHSSNWNRYVEGA